MSAGNAGIRSPVETLQQSGFDFTQSVADTQSWSLDLCTHVSNSGKASGATRQSVRTRAELLIQFRIRAHSGHSVRETTLAGMADSLSKGDVACFEQSLWYGFDQLRRGRVIFP